MKDITRSAMIKYNKLIKSHLLVIDDIMMFAMEMKQAEDNINRLSFLIISINGPSQIKTKANIHLTFVISLVLLILTNSSLLGVVNRNDKARSQSHSLQKSMVNV
jgi:hypothetical protein